MEKAGVILHLSNCGNVEVLQVLAAILKEISILRFDFGASSFRIVALHHARST